jgi:hypothetical protein
MIDRDSFSYEESIEAYDFFMNNVGFDNSLCIEIASWSWGVITD